MKLLVVGSGGREHAIAKKLLESPQVEQVFVHDNIYAYIVSLVSATRNNQYIDLGISPRGTIACTKMAKAYAYLCGRNYVIPEDVTAIFAATCRHTRKQ